VNGGREEKNRGRGRLAMASTRRRQKAGQGRVHTGTEVAGDGSSPDGSWIGESPGGSRERGGRRAAGRRESPAARQGSRAAGQGSRAAWRYESPAAVQVSRAGEMLGSGAVVSVLTSKEKKSYRCVDQPEEVVLGEREPLDCYCAVDIGPVRVLTL
jgi:hypothetical protein